METEQTLTQNVNVEDPSRRRVLKKLGLGGLGLALMSLLTSCGIGRKKEEIDLLTSTPTQTPKPARLSEEKSQLPTLVRIEPKIPTRLPTKLPERPTEAPKIEPSPTKPATPTESAREKITRNAINLLKEDLKTPIIDFLSNEEALRKEFPIKDERLETLIASQGGWREAREEDNRYYYNELGEKFAEQPIALYQLDNRSITKNSIQTFGDFMLVSTGSRKETPWAIAYLKGMGIENDWHRYNPGALIALLLRDNDGKEIKTAIMKLEKDGKIFLPADQSLWVLTVANFPESPAWLTKQ